MNLPTKFITNGDGDLFDVFFKDFFNIDSPFSNVRDKKISYPVDIIHTDEGLNIDIPAIGLYKEDVKISVEGDILRVFYDKKHESENDYIHHGITRKSFDFGWKIDSKLNIDKIKAEMDRGLLSLFIPYKKEEKQKLLKKEIKIE